MALQLYPGGWSGGMSGLNLHLNQLYCLIPSHALRTALLGGGILIFILLWMLDGY